MFKDDSNQGSDEDGEESPNTETERQGDTVVEDSRGATRNKTAGGQQTRSKSHSHPRKVPSQDANLKAYLGRDGGGSKSGMASPLYGSDEDSEPLRNPKPAFQPNSLARALR